MSMDQAADLALSLSLQITPQQTGPRLEGVEQPNLSLIHPSVKATALVEPLSARELEVLKMIAAGYTNLDIAQQLYIDVGTVKSHNTHIFAKMDVKNRTQAVNKARKMGLV